MEKNTVKRNPIHFNPSKRGLFMADHPDEPLPCDMCDLWKPLAHINCLCGDVVCICGDCLQDFAKAINKNDG